MKKLLLAVLASSILSGCVIQVPPQPAAPVAVPAVQSQASNWGIYTCPHGITYRVRANDAGQAELQMDGRPVRLDDVKVNPSNGIASLIYSVSSSKMPGMNLVVLTMPKAMDRMYVGEYYPNSKPGAAADFEMWCTLTGTSAE